MNLNRCGENHMIEGSGSLVVGEGFQIQFNSFLDIGERLFNCLTLGLATLKFGAPSVASMLIFFDYNTYFAHHVFHATALLRISPGLWQSAGGTCGRGRGLSGVGG